MSRAQLVTPAVRKGRKARVALSGPSGAGKTWTALELATALGAHILVVDTERDSASLYSDHFQFQTIDWHPPYDPRELSDDLRKVSSGFDVVVIDSLTHFWEGEGGTLDIVEAASARSAGNKFAGWKTGTPAQNGLVEAILQAACHVIVTMRSKMEYVLETDRNGRQVPRKVGMAPQQRAGIEYEFTVVADLDMEHRAVITKTRCAALADKMFQPGQAKDFGQTLSAWLDGAKAEQPPALSEEQAMRQQYVAAVQDQVSKLSGDERKALKAWWIKRGFPKVEQLNIAAANAVLDRLGEMPTGEAAA